MRPFGKTKGVIVINIDMNKINQAITSLGIKEKDKLYIFDDNQIYYTNIHDDLYKKPAEAPFLNGINFSDSMLFSDSYHKQNGTFLALAKSEYNKWFYAFAFDFNVSQFKIYMLIILLIGITIPLLLSLFITRKMYQPIENIISIFENPEMWLNTPESNTTAIDEFRYITHNILKNYDTQKKMELQLAQRLSSLRNAQVIALITQINPHFLFNTMSTIKLLAMNLTGGENEVSHMISLISDILMYSMKTTNHLVPIHEEISITKKYLQILELRYKDRFKIIWDIDKVILDHKIVKIALQPIIENAVEHGFKNINANGIIHIQGKLINDVIMIDITDNGAGMPEEQIASMNKEMTQDYIKENAHLGIYNVNQRIRLVFGEEYGLSFSAVKEGGLRVRLSLPA